MLNNPMDVVVSPSEQLSCDWIAAFDSCRSSIAHRLFCVKGDAYWIFVFAYCTCVAATLLPLICAAALDGQTLWEFAPNVGLPILRDWNITYTFLVSFPVLFLLLVADEAALKEALQKVVSTGVVDIAEAKARQLACDWTKIFERANRYSQIAGAICAAGLSWLTLDVYATSQVGFWAVPRDHITIIGFTYLYCIGLLYMLIIVYVTRCVCAALFFQSLVAHSVLRLLPFHPDGCGGLRQSGDWRCAINTP